MSAADLSSLGGAQSPPVVVHPTTQEDDGLELERYDSPPATWSQDDRDSPAAEGRPVEGSADDEMEGPGVDAATDAEDSFAPELVGYFGSELLLRGLVTALARAAREGIPATILGGYATVTTTRGVTFLDTAFDRKTLIQGQIDDNLHRIERASEVVLSSKIAAQIARYRQKEAEAWRAVERLQRELAALEAETAPEQPGAFNTHADQLQAALTRVALSGNRVSQEQFVALKAVMPHFEMRRDNLGQWTASATLRLALVGGGVADFGPVEWKVGSGGRGTAIRGSRRADVPGQEKREVLHARLLATGRLRRDRILLLLNSNFSELAHVVLHGATQRPFPDWVGPEWREQAYVDWITGWYTDDQAWWRRTGSYATFSHERQLLAHLGADLGPFGMDVVRELVPTAGKPYLRFASDVGQPEHRPWYRAVDSFITDGHDNAARRSSGSRRARHATRLFVSVTCSCGRAARVVARVPEIPRCLLCECGQMPEAERFGMDIAVRFPKRYQDVLLLSKEECVAQLNTAAGLLVLRPIEEQVLAQTDLLTRGATSSEVGQRVSKSAHDVHPYLVGLLRRGLLERTGRRYFVWTLPRARP